MNTKIFALIEKNLKSAFDLPKYQNLTFDENTIIDQLPWTPAKYRKFKDRIEAELHLPCDYHGTLLEIVDNLDERYIHRFFAEMWKPRTGDYDYSGWTLVDEINKRDPQHVLDVGCGYHPFKGRIKNLTGIDPYNDCADYMVDVLEYTMHTGKHDHIIALGSINFGTREDIEQRFAHCVKLLADNGKFYLRANPGIPHKTGPYVDIFPWSFAVVGELAEKYDLKLLEFKKDKNDRLYFVYEKLA